MTRRSRKILSDKIELLKLAENLGNVSAACRNSGLSRDTYYRLKRTYEQFGVNGLKKTTRRKPNLKNRLPSEIEDAILKITREQPLLGKKKVSEELSKLGLSVSPAGVRCVWLRHRVETQA